VISSSALRCSISGEVQRAGSYRLEQGHDGDAGALRRRRRDAARGTDRGLKIRRRAQDGALHSIDARLTDLIRANDVVYVRESWF
jgi:polysaccharide export outer membrane protein